MGDFESMKATSALAALCALTLSLSTSSFALAQSSNSSTKTIQGATAEHVVLPATETSAVTETKTTTETGRTKKIQINTNQTVTDTIITSKRERPKVGLALGGGGARGAAEVGVLKVLLEEGIPIDMIAGTSIGAVVGGLYASGFSIDELAERFDDSELMRNFMPVDLKVRIALAPIMFLPRLVGYHPYDGLYRGVKFRKYANRLAGDHNEISQLNPPFAAVVTDLVDGNSHRLTSGNLGQALQASTAVPGLRKPVEINDHLYCDGGLINNLPVNHVREMGADFIIAVNIDEDLDPVPLKTFRKAGSVSTQALKIQLYNIDKKPNEIADITIHPNTNGVSLISRSKKDGKSGIEAGIEAAHKAMPELKRKLAALGITPTRMVKAN